MLAKEPELRVRNVTPAFLAKLEAITKQFHFTKTYKDTLAKLVDDWPNDQALIAQLQARNNALHQELKKMYDRQAIITRQIDAAITEMERGAKTLKAIKKTTGTKPPARRSSAPGTGRKLSRH